MDWKKEWKIFAVLAGVFVAAYALPLENLRIQAAIQEAFRLLQWYARNHTLACVVPAMFIAGAIITFLSQGSVLRYLGARANPIVAYGVASVSGCILAVCSCSVLPMFAGIYKLGAGLGPATAFLYSGPAINILAIFLSARVLGFPLGAARARGRDRLFGRDRTGDGSAFSQEREGQAGRRTTDAGTRAAEAVAC